MRKPAILLIFTAMAALNCMADDCYTYSDNEGTPLYGSCRRVSDNGRWACGGDDYDETGSFVIDTTNPDNFIFTPDGLLLDINNDGVAVGAWFNRVGEYTKLRVGATFSNGIWSVLPMPDNTLGQSTAVAISADSKTVCGYVFCANENPDEPGKQFPILWKWDDATGRYLIDRVFNNLRLPGTYGFQVMDMSPDAKWVVGYQGLNVSDPICVALNVETGELRNFHDIEIKDVTLVTPHPITGEDVTFVTPEIFVDGLYNGAGSNGEFSSLFASCNERYAFGSRNEVYDVDEDGMGKIRTYPTVYDFYEDRFYDGPAGSAFYLCGTGHQLQFTSSGRYVFSGKTYNINEDFDTAGQSVAGIYDIDAQGRVLVGSYIYTDPMEAMHECPIILVLDQGLNSLAEIGADSSFPATVTVADGYISVDGAADVAIFSLSGALLTRSHKVAATPGVYVVIADGHSAKVVVK